METQTEYVLGTICSVNLFEYGSPKVYHEIFARMTEIERRMSANTDGTDIDAINKAAGIAPVQVHADVVTVLKDALRFAELSDGAFDPTIGPIVKLWNIGNPEARVPASSEIREKLPLVNWKNVVLDDTAKTVFLKEKGMRLDLGAIAKGYAADEAALIVKKHRIPRAIIDLGGNVLAYGNKKNGDSWRVGIQDPQGQRGAPIGIIRAKNKTMVTSGVYERFLEVDGVRYHHILSTKDGYPIQNGLLSVTIVADKSIDADALSTAIFALGYEEGRALVEKLGDVGAFFVFNDASIRVTQNIATELSHIDDRYHLVE